MSLTEAQKDAKAAAVLTTRVHGYTQVVASDFLQDRYPFIKGPDDKENRQTFTEEQGPIGGIHKCVFFRRIPTMVQVLVNPNTSSAQAHEALLILNETATVQEEKIKMIEANLVEIVFNFLDEKDELVCREALSLLGSLLSVREGRKMLASLDLKALRMLLMAPSRQIRVNLGWLLTRLSSGRDGVEHLVSQKLVRPIIQSFKKYAEVAKAETLFVLYLLQTMLEILRDDHNIAQFTGLGFSEQLNGLLSSVTKDPATFGKNSEEISFLSLECLSLFVTDNTAKTEAVASDSITAVEPYLEHKDPTFINSALRVLMFVAIEPKGRASIIDFPNKSILRHCKRLYNLVDKNIRENLAELVATLSEDVLRFRQVFNSVAEEGN